MKINFDYVKQYQTISSLEQQMLNEIYKKLEKKESMLDWLDIESCISSSELEEMKKISYGIRKFCDIFLVIGIGGSYLGSRAVLESLSPYFSKKKPEIIFAGHQLSGSYLKELLDYMEGKSVYVNVISKSGETLETMASFHMIYGWMKKTYSDVQKRVIVTIGDSSRGDSSSSLKKLADKEQLKTWIIPSEIGGRYSVFTVAGLFPLVVSGIDIDEFIKGAQSKRNCFSESSQYALVRKHLEERGKIVEAFTIYEEKLSFLAAWYQQLFAETQGKNQKGILPIINPNTTNLHSLGQYLQDGRRITFETVLQIKNTKDINLENERISMNELNHLVLNQVANAHSYGGTPSIIIALEELSPFEIGGFLYFLEVSAAIGGYLLEIDPFNQPGVEIYKQRVKEELKSIQKNKGKN